MLKSGRYDTKSHALCSSQVDTTQNSMFYAQMFYAQMKRGGYKILN